MEPTADVTMTTAQDSEGPLPECSTNEAALKAALVQAKSYEELEDGSAGVRMDLYLEGTLQMSKADDEEWRPQYDALENLRILNKFHGDVLTIADYAAFVNA